MAGDHGGAAEIIAVFERDKRHIGAIAGDVGGVAVLIAIENEIADDDEGTIDDVVHDVEEKMLADVVAFAIESELFLLEVHALGVVVDDVRGGVDDVAGGEDDAAAVGFDGRFFLEKAGVIVVLVLAAFDVDVGLEVGEELDGGVGWIDVDVIDELEGGKI